MQTKSLYHIPYTEILQLSAKSLMWVTDPSGGGKPEPGTPSSPQRKLSTLYI